MIVKVNQIFIILTPFHLEMMKQLFKKEFESGKSLIFFSENSGILKDEKNCFERIPSFNFSLKKLKNSVFSTSVEYRNQIKKIKNYCHELQLNKYSYHTDLKVIIGTDKDNFTQILLNILYSDQSLKIELSAVEEGIGFYLEENWIDKILANIYNWFTPIIFNERLQYHKQLGTDARINIVYARLPHLIPKYPQLEHKKLIKINLKESSISPRVSVNKKVLIYSFPNEDYAIENSEKKVIFDILLGKINKETEVYIKPHPRESIEVFLSIKRVNLIEKSDAGESLNYFEYDKVVNFSSSIIIDLLTKGYPKGKIFTIAMNNKKFPLFEETNLIKLNSLKNLNFEISN